jgi:hypothetical protein
MERVTRIELAFSAWELESRHSADLRECEYGQVRGTFLILTRPLRTTGFCPGGARVGHAGGGWSSQLGAEYASVGSPIAAPTAELARPCPACGLMRHLFAGITASALGDVTLRVGPEPSIGCGLVTSSLVTSSGLSVGSRRIRSVGVGP